jgi:hypothetical protein
MRSLLQVVTDIVTTAGLLKEFQTEVNFHLKCERFSAMGILTYWKEN